jgi:hypothetical protein
MNFAELNLADTDFGDIVCDEFDCNDFDSDDWESNNSDSDGPDCKISDCEPSDCDDSDFNMSRFRFKYFDSLDNPKAARFPRRTFAGEMNFGGTLRHSKTPPASLPDTPESASHFTADISPDTTGHSSPQSFARNLP